MRAIKIVNELKNLQKFDTITEEYNEINRQILPLLPTINEHSSQEKIIELLRNKSKEQQENLLTFILQNIDPNFLLNNIYRLFVCDNQKDPHKYSQLLSVLQKMRNNRTVAQQQDYKQQMKSILDSENDPVKKELLFKFILENLNPNYYSLYDKTILWDEIKDIFGENNKYRRLSSIFVESTPENINIQEIQSILNENPSEKEYLLKFMSKHLNLSSNIINSLLEKEVVEKEKEIDQKILSILPEIYGASKQKEIKDLLEKSCFPNEKLKLILQNIDPNFPLNKIYDLFTTNYPNKYEQILRTLSLKREQKKEIDKELIKKILKENPDEKEYLLKFILENLESKYSSYGTPIPWNEIKDIFEENTTYARLSSIFAKSTLENIDIQKIQFILKENPKEKEYLLKFILKHLNLSWKQIKVLSSCVDEEHGNLSLHLHELVVFSKLLSIIGDKHEAAYLLQKTGFHIPAQPSISFKDILESIEPKNYNLHSLLSRLNSSPEETFKEFSEITLKDSMPLKSALENLDNVYARLLSQNLSLALPPRYQMEIFFTENNFAYNNMLEFYKRLFTYLQHKINNSIIAIQQILDSNSTLEEKNKLLEFILNTLQSRDLSFRDIEKIFTQIDKKYENPPTTEEGNWIIVSACDYNGLNHTIHNFPKVDSSSNRRLWDSNSKSEKHCSTTLLYSGNKGNNTYIGLFPGHLSTNYCYGFSLDPTKCQILFGTIEDHYSVKDAIPSTKVKKGATLTDSDRDSKNIYIY